VAKAAGNSKAPAPKTTAPVVDSTQTYWGCSILTLRWSWPSQRCGFSA